MRAIHLLEGVLFMQANLKRVLQKEAAQKPAPEDPPHAPALNRALQHAESLRRGAGDTHIAGDHLLLGLLAEADKDTREALVGPETKLSRAAVEHAAAALRQARPIKSEQAEESWDALRTFAYDLVAKAEAGKLDPVIGRDEVAALHVA